MKNPKYKSPDSLGLKDSVFTIGEFQMMEHEDFRRIEESDLSEIRYFALQKHPIKSIAEGENGKTVVINGTIELPKNGKLVHKLKDIVNGNDALTDEKEALVMVITALAKEDKKARETVETAKKVAKGVRSCLDVHIKKAEALNIIVQLKDRDTVEFDGLEAEDENDGQGNQMEEILANDEDIPSGEEGDSNEESGEE